MRKESRHHQQSNSSDIKMCNISYSKTHRQINGFLFRMRKYNGNNIVLLVSLFLFTKTHNCFTFYYIYKSEDEEEDGFCCFEDFDDTFVQSSKRGRFRELDRA